MNLFNYFFWTVYRIWFYLISSFSWIILFPFLFVFSLKESWYPKVFKLATLWSNTVLLFMGFYWRIDHIPILEKGKNYMFISNHTSMMDIMCMISIFKDHPFVFVGKIELSKVPFFGVIYKRACPYRANNSRRYGEKITSSCIRNCSTISLKDKYQAINEPC